MSTSSSHLNTGFSGSGALSHVYIRYPPLRCNVPGARGLFYDDASKLLVSPTSDQVFSWKTSPFSPTVGPTSDSVSEGPILSIRYSLDAKVLAIQRSSHEVQFWNREAGNTFVQRCRTESESILGFFWTDCSTCDVVFVKTSGLDLYSLGPELKSLRLVETKKCNVSWYVYTHESRLVLLASGMQCKNFLGYQLSSSGIIRLPKFEMAMAMSEANSKPVLAAEDVHTVTVYGRIYCLQVDRVAMVLHLYRFYRDAVVQQGSLPIYSSKIAVNVVDNVLLVHQVDAKVVILYDIFSDSRAPISAPLPLLLRNFPRAASFSSLPIRRDLENSETKGLSDTEGIMYGDGWTFLVPDLICDATNGLLWKIQLDLEAIAASSSEVPSILELLQRRKLEAYKAKQICLALLRTIILERRPVAMVAKAMDVLVTSYAYSIKTGSYLKQMKTEKSPVSGAEQVNSPKTSTDGTANGSGAVGKSPADESGSGAYDESITRSSYFPDSDSDDNVGNGLHGASSGDNPLSANMTDPQESQVTSAAICPDEMYSIVFASIDEEMTGDSSYLVAVIVEFLRSANLEKVKVHPNVYVLTIQLLARAERYMELGLFILNKILEPSKEVAVQLLESGRQHLQTRKLGLDMLRQLSLHEDYVVLLVQDGYYLEALHYVRKYEIKTVRPSLFLEAALTSNDSQHLAAVMRFFLDFIPGFKATSDYNTYSQILAQMNSSIAV